MKDSVEESCELFINGNLDLAIENNLNGVHFPEKYQINEYQNKENLILGRSIHENTDLNKHQKKFDYFHLGPIFLTQSHPNQNTIKEKNINLLEFSLLTLVTFFIFELKVSGVVIFLIYFVLCYLLYKNKIFEISKISSSLDPIKLKICFFADSLSASIESILFSTGIISKPASIAA